MKINVPKELKGFAFDQVIPLDFNTFDIDLLLPSLFFKVVSRGQIIGRHVNDATQILNYSQALASHPDVDGLGDNDHLADRLARTALVKVGRPNRSRNLEQIEGILGHTLLAFKPGFPTHQASLRRVDAMVYRMMRDQLRGEEQVLTFFNRVFGAGLSLQTGAVPDGGYDHQSEVDTLTRLSMAYLDGFQPTGIRKRTERTYWDALPPVSKLMSRDLRRYLSAYHAVMPIDALTFHLKALINFELFIFSLKLFYAIGDLVDDPTVLPTAMGNTGESSPPEIYVDFSGDRTGHGREMASTCVRRDLEAIQRFILANLSLRYLDQTARGLRKDRHVGPAIANALGDTDGGSEYLQGLLLLREDSVISPRIELAAQHDESILRNANSASSDDDNGDDLLEGVYKACCRTSLRSMVPPNAAQIIPSLVSVRAS